MVKFWDIQLEKAIATTKRRIKFMEKHGIGIAAMKEKAKLKTQEHQRELNKQ